VGRGGEDGHLGADLGDDVLGADQPDAGHRVELLHLVQVGLGQRLDGGGRSRGPGASGKSGPRARSTIQRPWKLAPSVRLLNGVRPAKRGRRQRTAATTASHPPPPGPKHRPGPPEPTNAAAPGEAGPPGAAGQLGNFHAVAASPRGAMTFNPWGRRDRRARPLVAVLAVPVPGTFQGHEGRVPGRASQEMPSRTPARRDWAGRPRPGAISDGAGSCQAAAPTAAFLSAGPSCAAAARPPQRPGHRGPAAIRWCRRSPCSATRQATGI